MYASHLLGREREFLYKILLFTFWLGIGFSILSVCVMKCSIFVSSPQPTDFRKLIVMSSLSKQSHRSVYDLNSSQIWCLTAGDRGSWKKGTCNFVTIFNGHVTQFKCHKDLTYIFITYTVYIFVIEYLVYFLPQFFKHHGICRLWSVCHHLKLTTKIRE